jgi:predicted butyrate kinase (DUF1464 family)
MRVIGIDPGTVSVDLCGIDDGRVFLDTSMPTREALAEPARLAGVLERAAPLDLVAGPSGYGLPLTNARDLTERDLRLAYLAAAGEEGGIGGLRALMRVLARSPVPMVLTPGVVHLPSVPAHRKINRVDMGTADKVCAVALAIHERAERRGVAHDEVSFVLLELGGAFTAALAVDRGRIVDGVGGTSGPLGMRAAGALDGEVAFLARTITKDFLFHGGVASIAGEHVAFESAPAENAAGRIAWDAYVEAAVKAVAAMAVAVPHVPEIVLSGRFAHVRDLRHALIERCRAVVPSATLHVLTGFASVGKQAAQGAALIADGLAGGRFAPLVATLGIREASGTVLDHLHVISPQQARERLGLE